jgi:plasmid stabilization system protein ParE
MPCEVRWSSRAVRDLDRLADFLKSKNPSATQQAVTKIRDGVLAIATMPNIGVAMPDSSGRRE